MKTAADVLRYLDVFLAGVAIGCIIMICISLAKEDQRR